MEPLGLVARFATLSVDDIVMAISNNIVDPIFPTDNPISLTRRCIITWAYLYIGALLIYFIYSSLDFLVVFGIFRKQLLPKDYFSKIELRREIWFSVRSLSIMALMSTPMEVAVQFGYSKIYHDHSKHGYLYLIVSPILFILFSDCIIYFIHRGLHHRYIYKYVHKPHHSFINTSPFAAFAFHPLDGYLQGCSYQIFPFILPFHGTVHMISLIIVSIWTINIHDRVSIGIPGVNGAKHHTIHHMTFRSNYGQYFTFWDKICGTFRSPWDDNVNKLRHMNDKEVYGKYA